MSILSINEETFQLSMMDFMEDPNRNLDVDIWAAHRGWEPGSYADAMSDMHHWTTEMTRKVRSRILALGVIKPTGRQIRKILKDVLGLNLSVRVHKYMFREQGTVHAYYDIAANANPAVAYRIDKISDPSLPYDIQHIRLIINYPKMNVPKEGLKF